MPAEVPTTEKSLPSSADKMPTTTQKSNGDLGQTTPVFSYAQAAKGRAPSVSLSLPNGKALSDTPEAGPKRPSMSESRDSTSNPSNSSTKRTASEGREPQGKDFTGDEERPPARLGGIKYTPKSDNDSDTPVVAGLSHRAGSTPSSPEYGATSTSTLPKEDDTCSTANGSSESTWEKQSQMSQNGNKSGDKVDVEKDRQAPTSWDEESSAISASLKEAPPPPVNFWQQRREAQEAEARARLKRSASAQPTRTANLNRGPGHDGGPAKGADTNTEPKKQDNRKKGKNGAGPTEDRPGLGAAKDGMRSVDTADKSTNVAFAGPPPPGDAISWPTPDSAIGEGKEKEKVHERAEKVSDKDTTAAPQTHGKKWLPMAYVPSAVFVTPMHQVRRGGRLLRGTGGRGGSSSNASISAEKPAAGGVNISNGQAPLAAGTERGRGPINSSTTNATVSKGKRASSAGPITPREQWRSGEPTAPEKRNKETDIGSSKSGQSNGTNVNELRGSIVATSNKDPKDKLPSWAASQVSVSDVARNSDNSMHSNTNEDKNTRGKHLENQMSPRGGPERRSEGSIRAPDFAKDFQGGLPMRERGDGRQDRGRGGFRGRGGGNHAYLNSNVPNGHGFPNGHQPQYQSPPGPPAKSHSNHDRSPSQNQGSFYPPTQDPNRHHRNNSRSQSIPYSTQYGRFSNGHQSGAPHLANLQTDLANTYGFQPGQQGIMSAIPYNPFMEEVSLYGMMSMQMEYYFSVDNLCKDMFLRRQMDSQGFVFLEVLAKFNRIKQLTTNLNMIRYACVNSPSIEYYTPPDGIDRIRKRDGWQHWVLKMEERDPPAQNDGPPMPRPEPPQIYNVPHTSDDRQGMSPRFGAISPMENIQYQSLDDATPASGRSDAAGVVNAAEASTTRTPLSAAVSEFSPSVRSINNRSFSSQDSHTQASSVFTDEQVDNLHIIVRKPMNSAVPTHPPFHSSSSRTFSNGSIDGRSINDELAKYADRQPAPTHNGDNSDTVDSNRVQRSRSPFPIGSPGRHMDNNMSPPVLWIKDRQAPINPLGNLQNKCVYELYHDFRRDALKQREQSATEKPHHDNMQNLYQFWSHFLIRNFNARMYEEFRVLALEDAAERDSMTGIRSLLQYYDESILSQKTISDDNIARDFIDLVKIESSSQDRPAFAKLRAVWRNGAFNMKNRVKLSKFIEADLKSELDS